MTNIVIIGRGRLALARQTIESLYANTDPSQFNAVFVSDQDDDFRVLRYLRGINHKNFSLLEVSSNGSHVLSQLKNLGAYYSEQRWGRGDWLYFSDNDVWFAPQWLEKLTTTAAAHEHLGFSLFGGQIHPFHQRIANPPIIKDQKYLMSEYAILDGPSWLMRWNTWDTYGPLQRTTATGVCQSEEVPFCADLVKDGGRIGVIEPRMVVHTGLSQTDGKEAPGAAERRLLIPKGVLAE